MSKGRGLVNVKDGIRLQNGHLPTCNASVVNAFPLSNALLSLYPPHVSKKSAKIAALIEACRGRGLDPHYLGYFECFNRGLFYEAHDVLEELWLADRKGPNGNFFKGLIQLAGAFVHLRKGRLHPAAALFKLARANLLPYPAAHERLDTRLVVALIDDWLQRLENRAYASNPLHEAEAPHLSLRSF